MSAPEILVRLLVALLCWATGAAVLLPVVAERRGLTALAVMVAIGGIAAGIAITWPRSGGEDR